MIIGLKNRISLQSSIAGVLIVMGVGLMVISYGQVWWASGLYWLHQHSQVVYSVDANQTTPQVKIIQPMSKDFGLVIEKIDVNEQVKADVDPFDSAVYLPILQQYGVAEAKGGVAPGQIGTTYLFGHSTINFWEIGRYHAPFTLLDKVAVGDRIVVYYKGQRYNYIVKDRKVVLPTEVHYLTDTRVVPTLVLQTCDPPGENTKRLLVIAELATYFQKSPDR
jgi:LPXTG-site transpeptidase (sortase) family protein